MKTTWDYTELADAYLKRPQYSLGAIRQMLTIAGVRAGDIACDIGAGTGHLTLLLLRHGIKVMAVEPNDAMRVRGIVVTRGLDVEWFEGLAESTGMQSGQFDLVTFGSSFNTTDRPRALLETHRILRPEGWFACMWNHRDLSEPLQARVERVIQDYLPDYRYGARREDQSDAIRCSGLFSDAQLVEESYVASVQRDDYIEAWRSHATLKRQSSGKFDEIVGAIGECIGPAPTLTVPYTTRIWMARRLPHKVESH